MNQSNDERSLSEKELHMRLFMGATSDCFWNWNMVSNEVERSTGFERAFGYEKNEIMPGIEWWIDRLHPEDKDKVLATFNAACAEGKINTSYEYRFRRKDGSYAIIEDHVCLIRDGKGGVIRSLGAMHDITERKQIEDKLRHTLRMESLGTLTGGIAHEFNNLLTPMLGHAEMLLRGKTEDDPDWHDLSQIRAAGNRAKELVRQLLFYGRRSAFQKKSLRLEAVLEDVVQLLERTIPQNISLKKEIEVNLPMVPGMPDEIHQVILNLCVNAIQAMPDGGVLTLGLERRSPQELARRPDKPGEYLDLSVQDTGSGIDEAIIDRIFDPFFTTKAFGHGSGLGLSVVQGVVEKHGGYVEVESTVGQGSTFHLCLPVFRNETKDSVGSETPSAGRAGVNWVLVIDDEPLVLDFVTSVLKKHQCRVAGFSSPTEALSRFKESPADFALVVSDFGMPVMNGRQLIDKIRVIRDDIPVVLITGYGEQFGSEDVLTAGISEILFKPIEIDDLLRAVRKFLKN